MATCSSCDRDLNNIRYQKIETGNHIYETCIPCLKKARIKLKKMTYKTIEEDLLLKQLDKLLTIN